MYGFWFFVSILKYDPWLNPFQFKKFLISVGSVLFTLLSVTVLLWRMVREPGFLPLASLAHQDHVDILTTLRNFPLDSKYYTSEHTGMDHRLFRVPFDSLGISLTSSVINQNEQEILGYSVKNHAVFVDIFTMARALSPEAMVTKSTYYKNALRVWQDRLDTNAPIYHTNGLLQAICNVAYLAQWAPSDDDRSLCLNAYNTLLQIARTNPLFL